MVASKTPPTPTHPPLPPGLRAERQAHGCERPPWRRGLLAGLLTLVGCGGGSTGPAEHAAGSPAGAGGCCHRHGRRHHQQPRSGTTSNGGHDRSRRIGDRHGAGAARCGPRHAGPVSCRQCSRQRTGRPPVPAGARHPRQPSDPGSGGHALRRHLRHSLPETEDGPRWATWRRRSGPASNLAAALARGRQLRHVDHLGVGLRLRHRVV